MDLIRILEDEESITPPIFDATDILEKPEQALKKICNSVGICFSQKMLKWPKGKRKSDRWKKIEKRSKPKSHFSSLNKDKKNNKSSKKNRVKN